MYVSSWVGQFSEILIIILNGVKRALKRYATCRTAKNIPNKIWIPYKGVTNTILGQKGELFSYLRLDSS